MKVKVLFICLGNICRSPMAEGVFQHLVDEAGLTEKIDVDSAGTSSWHVGDKAHPGTRKVLDEHNISYNGRSRQVGTRDMENAMTYIIAMDQSNMNDLLAEFGPHQRLFRLLDFAEFNDVKDVPDPYYNGNFERVYQLVEDGCRGLLNYIRREEGL